MPEVRRVPTFAPDRPPTSRHRAALAALAAAGVPAAARPVLLAHLLLCHGAALERSTCNDLGPLEAPPDVIEVTSEGPEASWRPGPLSDAGTYYVAVGEDGRPRPYCAWRSLRTGALAFAREVARRPALWAAATAGDLGAYGARLAAPDPSGAPAMLPTADGLEVDFGPELRRLLTAAGLGAVRSDPRGVALAVREAAPEVVGSALGSFVRREGEKVVRDVIRLVGKRLRGAF